MCVYINYNYRAYIQVLLLNNEMQITCIQWRQAVSFTMQGNTTLCQHCSVCNHDVVNLSH